MITKLLMLVLVLTGTTLPTEAQNPLRFSTNNGVITITGYGGVATNIVIPDMTNGYPIVNVGAYAFENCTSLTNVVIGNNVTNIGDNTFYWCLQLTSVAIPGNLKSIGSYAFYSCPTLVSVTMPNTLTSMGAGAFYGCYSLTNVTIPNSLTSIAAQAFAGCVRLTNVMIPNSITGIGNEAFRGSGLMTVAIPNSVTGIGYFAFESCGNLTSVTIPNSVRSIWDLTFESCSKLRTATIGNGITNIGTRAFSNCSSLTNITFLGNAPSEGEGGNIFNNVPGTVYYYYGASGWGATFSGRPTIMLGTPVPQIANNFGVQSNKFVFTITGVANQTIVVEASTNLFDWLPLWTNRLSGTSTNFTDSQAANYPRRFYHVQSW